MRISDWSSVVCSSDLADPSVRAAAKLVVRDPGAAGPRDLATGCEQSDQRPSGALCALGDRRRLSVGDAGHRDRRLSHRDIERRRTAARHGDEPVRLSHRKPDRGGRRSEEHTSELQSLMRISYAVFCLKKKKKNNQHNKTSTNRKKNPT